MMELKWVRFIKITVMMSVLFTVTNACLEHERIALLHLKPFFNHYNDLYDWKGSDCCGWARVECNTTSRRLIRLSLNSTRRENLGYPYLNASLFLPFQGLKSLYLPSNSIAGFLENEGFVKLSSGLNNLEILDLSENHLNDSLLLSLSQLSSLRYLNLAHNQLEGSIHLNEWNSLTNLKFLDLSYNRIESISNQDETQLRLTNLEELRLSGNLFRNNTLSFLGGLSSLQSLYMSENHLQGSLHLEGLENLTNLKNLNLIWNKIESLQSCKGDGRKLKLTHLENLHLDGNLFNNSVFASLKGFSNLKFLSVADNQLKGSLDTKDLVAFTNLSELDISRNQLKDFVIYRETKGLRKLNVVHLNEVFTAGSIPLQNIVEAFSSVKTFFLQGNYQNMTLATRGLNVSTKVEKIYLDQSTLNTNILQSIGVFTSLQTLSLSGCGLIGSLPNQGWCDLRNLQVLVLSQNALEGMLPHCLGNLTSLRKLDISDNHFIGSLTPLSNLTSLTSISLTRNHFQIPMSFVPLENLTNLKVLSIDENMMVKEPSSHTSLPKFQLESISLSKCITSQGLDLQLPTFLHYQYDLRFVDLSGNNFSGTFPVWLLENNSKLDELILMDNSFKGPLSLPSVPNFDLSSFDISENRLQGPIPSKICSTFPHLMYLYLYKNAFEGNIPPCLSGMKNLLFLDLSNNQLSGRVPEELIRKRSLSILRLSNNNLSGNIVPVILNAHGLSNLYLDGNSFSGEMANVDVSTFQFPTSLSDVDLSNNKLYGKLPRWIGNLSYLERLALSNNSFEGSIPMELCNLNRLEFLQLDQNNLSGSIPSCFNPPNIEHVHLHGNRLSGPLSLALYDSSSLVTLDLGGNNFTGTIPKWIGKLSSLSVLLLRSNNLQGRIPVQLCKMYSLSIIDLSQNMFSGSVPSCLGNLTLSAQENKILEYGGYISFSDHVYPSSYFKERIDFTTKNGSYSYEGNILQYMTGIDLSCNKLTGHIPPELGNLSEIYSLNLSHNYLVGVIPSSFSKLKKMESLDLSHNDLSGEIPNQLVELNNLEVFSVAYNNLSGSIPEPKAQFGTFIESSYEGNPLLCGLLLHKSCSKTDSPSTSDADEGEDRWLDTYVFQPVAIQLWAIFWRITSPDGVLSCREVFDEVEPVLLDPKPIFFISNLALILVGMYESDTDMSELARLSGPLSYAFYNSSSLVTLDLGGNNLTGSIPEWIGTLSSLKLIFCKAEFQFNYASCIL
ncbi:hypothetical protein V6N11_065516 [Hibiscus sabdariffa]|uniref:Leucine-rich repeat-containing N-terminal plant-type domain-containing protein n=1 Tax=Hibiscus sabdariffa TaxID=183260 RepID=A0ABR2PHJ2_9ROSI